MPTIHIEHPCYIADGSLLENGWRITCTYSDSSHCDIEYDVVRYGMEFVEVISEALIEGDYSEEYIRQHYRPHLGINE